MVRRKTSLKPWHEVLTDKLADLGAGDDHPKIAVVGIGNECSGDDRAGIAVAEGVVDVASECLAVFVTGTAPESFTGLIRRFAPDLVLLVDAVWLDEKPGTVRWLTWEDVTGACASTHALPLSVLAQFLVRSIGCEVALIGIQPHSVLQGTETSREVNEAVQAVIAVLQRIFVYGAA